MKQYFLSAFLAFSLVTQAQNTYNKFQWEPQPALHTIEKKYQDAAAVFVADDRIIEYAFEKEGLFFYKTFHRIIHINNDKGIESFNKIYLPFEEGVSMLDVKARAVLPNGKIIELDKNNIKDLKEEDGQYKIFALEGLVKDCEVEYYYTVKKEPSFFGREILSARIPVVNAHFELISPNQLVFEARSYNNLPQSKDTSYGEKRYLLIDDANINEAEEEKYSMYQANLKRVEYKLCYNKGKNARERMFTWNELAKRVFDVYSTIGDKDKKKVKDLLETINISPSATDVEKIMTIENFLKKNFITRDNIPNEDADDLGKVIKNKIASERAIARLYIGLFTLANIDYQIVLTGDRNDYTLDRNFENWNSAKNLLFYFPSTNKFIAPTEMEYRYPWIPPTWASTNGLYCIGTTIGNFTTAVGEVKGIPQEAFDYNFQNMEMNLKLDKDDALIVDVKQSYGGYAAPNYRIPFVYMPADQQDKVLKEMIKFGTNSENILSHSFENKELEQKDPYKPFIINASVKSTNLVERAGQKMIVKIGEVIGQQVELYETKARQSDMDVNFPHSLVRTITFTIPEGYKIKNLADLNFNVTQKEKDAIIMGFVSSYEQSGNTLKIVIKEDYRHVTYPVQMYDAFKKVINAAADFNKVVLILDKEG